MQITSPGICICYRIKHIIHLKLMNNKTQLRIVNDIIKFKESKFDALYINFDKDNISKIYAMIIGPSNTPYFGGTLFFEICFPDNYPYSPPKVKFLTINNKVRFNPNLYSNGKVCLSILGTWPGPKWEPVMTLTSVLLSIQSLLSETPLRNEPGFTNINMNDIKSINYNNYIIYNTYELAILNVLNKHFKVSKLFKNEIIQNLNLNYNKLKNDILSYKEILGKHLIHSLIYFSALELDFALLCTNFLESTEKYISDDKME